MPIAMPRPGAAEPFTPDLPPDFDFVPHLRAAKVSDVHAMSALINQYASSNVMLARGPQYLYQHIQDYMVVTAPLTGGEREVVVACGAVHVLWADLAEVRSVAVHPACKGRGMGRLLVGCLLDKCRALDIPRAFVFTLVPGFFRRCGFAEFDRDTLPPIVWVECSKCPKFYRCDEIGMICSLQ